MTTRTEPLAAELKAATGRDPFACYQCGKCSAGCPMAGEMALKPHQMLRLAQLDQRERLLSDASLWLCLTCETCSARCPNEVDPARMIDALRELALRAGVKPPRRILGFHRSFLEQVRLFGRVFEVGMVAGYKLRTGDLLSDVLNAPVMLGHGKLGLWPKRVEGIDEVRRIFEVATKPSEQEGP